MDPWYVVFPSVALGGLVLFFIFISPFWVVRRLFTYTYKRLSKAEFEALQSDSFIAFLRSQMSVNLTDQEIRQFIRREHKDIKLFGPGHNPKRELVSLRFMVQQMQAKFSHLSSRQIKQIFKAEKKYLRSLP